MQTEAELNTKKTDEMDPPEESKPSKLSCSNVQFESMDQVVDEDGFEHQEQMPSSISLNSAADRLKEDLLFSPSEGFPYPPCAPAGWRWVLLDGPVDSDWIENLNSVLDDSKVLCLSNGERIKLHSGSRILFETDDLTNASPATISRCGVVYLVRDQQM